MKTKVLNFFAFILFIGFVFAVNSCSKDDIMEDEGAGIALKSGVSASASGHGTFIDYPEVGLKRQFSFHAKVMPDGTVQGSGQLTLTTGELDFKFDITCMVIEGNVARMAGIVNKNSRNPDYEGLGCFFAVQDNGEGSVALEPDILTLVYVGLPLPADCEAYFNTYGYPPYGYIEGGNIQVKP